MIRYVTRFTEEIFALVIALVYLYEPFKKLYKVKSHRLLASLNRFFQIFQSNPVRAVYNYDYPLTCLCNISSIPEMINPSYDLLATSAYSCYNCLSSKQSPSSSYILNPNNSTSITSDESQLPNKALLSFIILFGTCFISVALKRFRRSTFFGRTVDFFVFFPISMFERISKF